MSKQLKLFSTKTLIDKNVITQNDKKKWKKAFQEYCDSEEIIEESANNGLNACGYYYACDLCDGADKSYACARATIQYLKEKGISIDYRNLSKEYLDKILRYED